MTFSAPRFELHTLSQYLRYAQNTRHEEAARVSGVLAAQQRHRVMRQQREADARAADMRRADEAWHQQQEVDFRAAAAQRRCTFDADTGKVMPNARCGAAMAIRPAAVRAFHESNKDSVCWWSDEPTGTTGRRGRDAHRTEKSSNHNSGHVSTNTAATTTALASLTSARVQQLALPKTAPELPPDVQSRMYTGSVPIVATRTDGCTLPHVPRKATERQYSAGRDRDRVNVSKAFAHRPPCAETVVIPTTTTNHTTTTTKANALTALCHVPHKDCAVSCDAMKSGAANEYGSSMCDSDEWSGLGHNRDSASTAATHITDTYNVRRVTHDAGIIVPIEPTAKGYPCEVGRQDGVDGGADMVSIFSHGSSNAPLGVLGVSHMTERATKASTIPRLLRAAATKTTSCAPPRKDRVATDDSSVGVQGNHFAHMSLPQIAQWLVHVQQTRRRQY